MIRVNLGVYDIPYSDENGLTTGDVAEILEEKYGIFETFAEWHGQDISDDIGESLKAALENAVLGAPLMNDPFAEAESKIEQRMKHFLDAREMDGKVPGVATQAAKDGVNHRLKHPYAKSNPERPSFIDTGMLQASMGCKIEES